MSDDLTGDLRPLAEEYPELAAWYAARPAPAMPEEVWQRLQATLAAQTPLTSADPTVTALAAHRTRRTRRVAPILGAAAGLVLVGAVGVPLVLGGTAASPPVAEPAPVTVSAPADPSAAPSPSVTDDAPAPAPTATAAPTVTTPTTALAVPARLVLESGTDYTADTMATQVAGLLSTAGLAGPSDSGNLDERMAEEVMAVQSAEPAGLPPLIGASGFTAGVDELRDCIGRMFARGTGSSDAMTMPALVVDRARYQGNDVGVVVLLHTPAGGTPALQVGVVDPACTDADVAASVWFRYDLP